MYAETTERPSKNFSRNVLISSDITRLFHQNPLGGDLQTPKRGLKIGCKSTKNIGNNYICTQKNDILLANFLHLFIKREKFVNVISFNHWIGGFSSIPSGEIAICKTIRGHPEFFCSPCPRLTHPVKPDICVLYSQNHVPFLR